MRTFFAVTAAVAALALGGPAAADVYTVTYEGVVRASQDLGGLDLTGRAYTAVFTVNTLAPGSTLSTFNTATQTDTRLQGGGAGSPVSATLKIAGLADINVAGSLFGLVSELSNPSAAPDKVAQLVHTAQDYRTYQTGADADLRNHVEFGLITFDVFSSLNAFLDGDVLTRPQSRTLQAGDEALGLVSIASYFTPAGSVDQIYDYNTKALLDITRYTVATQVAVPEPGAWALMILGFGGLGSALRRRRCLAAA